MATVTVVRRLQYFGVFRQILIEADGQEVGGVRVKGELELEMSAGIHTFWARMSWVGSNMIEVDVKDDGTTRIGIAAPFRRALSASRSGWPVGGYREFARDNPGFDLYEYSATGESG